MYKETLDILMEDINDHDAIKLTILKNQLEYHFTNKNEKNKNVLDNSTVIARRILDRFPLSKIIGIQPIVDKENPTVISKGVEYDVDVTTRLLNAGYTEVYDINIESEINQAVATEVELEIINEFLHIIADNAEEINIISPERDGTIVTDTIKIAIEEVKANWIIVTPLILAMLQSDKNSHFTYESEEYGTMGDLQRVGWLDNDVTVYCTLWGTTDTVLIGRKEDDREDTPIVYAPEVMLMAGLEHPLNVKYPLSHEPKTTALFTKTTALFTRDGKFIHQHDVKDHYRKISIKFENNG